METDLPSTLSYRFGITAYQLSDQDLLHPGELVDRLVQKTEVCRAGAFVGRLMNGPSLCDTKDNVERVKDFLCSDKKSQMDIKLLQRMLLPGENRAFLIHSTGEGENHRQRTFLQSLRKNFTKNVLAHNFEVPPKSELECVLDTGVGNFLNFMLGKLTVSEPIMDAMNIDVFPMLSTTELVKLSSMTSNIQKLRGGRHVGIVSPTIYIGSEASTFNCHREDVAFEAVNRHVAGSPKIWFIVPPRFYNAFCVLLNKLGLPADEVLCSVYVQHKLLWIDPRIVLKYGIPVRIIIQRPGDIVFVLGNTIHWGVNLGLNINEAVNIASDTWARPGMMCLPTCQCPNVAGLDLKFDVTAMLRSIGVSEDTISRYEQGDTMQVSEELRFIYPDLHPEMGIPDSTATNVEHLLGPEADWDLIGKIPKPLLLQGHDRFVGGFDLLDLDLINEEDSEDADMIVNAEEKSMDVHADSEDVDNPQEDKAAVLGDDKEPVVRGTYKCPSCGHDSKRYGKRGMTALRHHIKCEHLHESQKLFQFIIKMYSRSNRKFCSPSLICDLCHKTMRGTYIHLSRHQESRNCCPQVNDPGTTALKKRNNKLP